MEKKILYLVANNSEVMEVLDSIDILTRLDFKVDLVSADKTKNLILSPINLKISVNFLLEEIKYKEYDILVIPGGNGYKIIDANESIDEIIKYFVTNKKIAAICAAPSIIAKRGYLNGKVATSFPSFKEEMESYGVNYVNKEVVVSGNIITAKNHMCSSLFGIEIAKILGKGKEAANLLIE